MGWQKWNELLCLAVWPVLLLFWQRQGRLQIRAAWGVPLVLELICVVGSIVIPSRMAVLWMAGTTAFFLWAVVAIVVSGLAEGQSGSVTPVTKPKPPAV